MTENYEKRDDIKKTSKDVSKYSTTIQDLASLHDPKSIQQFNEIFDSSSETFYTVLNTDPTDGLGMESLEKDIRHARFGVNKLPVRDSKAFWVLCWEALQDRTLIILSVAAVVSLALGLYELYGQPAEFDAEGVKIPKVDWVEGVAILVAVVVVVLVGAVNDYQKELQFKNLSSQEQSGKKINLIREGLILESTLDNLLVGDLVSLKTGDVIPCDCVLVSGGLQMDESSITGESDTIKKLSIEEAIKYSKENPDSEISLNHDQPDPMVISGSLVIEGAGKAIITAVGENSMNGRTMMALHSEDEMTSETPMQKRLTTLADNISIFGLLASVLLFVILLIKFGVTVAPKGKINPEYGKPYTSTEKGNKFMNLLITCIALIAVAIPEGLPLAVTLALAFATKRMFKDGNLVRRLVGCEVMGSATCINTDKTGTLTMNKMTVVNAFLGSTKYDLEVSADHQDFAKSINDEMHLNLLENLVLNSSAFESQKNDAQTIRKETQLLEATKSKKSIFKKIFGTDYTQDEIDKFITNEKNKEPYTGSKVEVAMLVFSQKFLNLKTGTLNNLRSNMIGLPSNKIVYEVPFESKRKWSMVVTSLKDDDENYKVFIKGASEIVAGFCKNTTLPSSGEVVPIDLNEVLENIETMASDALRTIAVAHLTLPKVKFDLKVLHDDVISNLGQNFTLDALIGVKDPLRPNVRESVLKCHLAGVTVRMVTGDNLTTAKAIARNAAILPALGEPHNFVAIEGPAFRKLSDEELNDVVPNLRVLARSSPEDKRILTAKLMSLGEVVAVTGDGTNDAPSLKLADVGFAMGIAGTEVAKEASDVILTKDDFTSIVEACKWGRCVAVSIKKFVQFQLTVNVTAVVLTFVSAVASSEETSVLSAVQLLWVNLIMDTLAALALATDKPSDDILKKKPTGRFTPLISPSMYKMIFFQSVNQIIITFVLHFRGAKLFFGDNATAHQKQQINALTFNTFVWLQFFAMICTRKFDEADDIKNPKDRFTMRNLNFFEGFFSNFYFLAIISIIGGFQVLIMFVGGATFSIARQTGAMWATAIICGLMSLVVAFVVRLIPDHWLTRFVPESLIHWIEYYLFMGWLRARAHNKKMKKQKSDVDTNHSESKGNTLSSGDEISNLENGTILNEK
ncbi:hypothetical protein QEN19_000508 [Hanseniaspora menglaensis]